MSLQFVPVYEATLEKVGEAAQCPVRNDGGFMTLGGNGGFSKFASDINQSINSIDQTERLRQRP